MKLIEIYEKIDEIAPFGLSKEFISRYGAYDNSGILLDSGDEVEGVLFSLDLTKASEREAEQMDMNCIITHHPAIYKPLQMIGADTAIGRCVREGISVISAHLNLDAAPGGIDESLMQAFGGKDPEIMQPLTGGGYGRVYSIDCNTMDALVNIAQNQLHAQRFQSYGNAHVHKIASFCGGGFDEEALSFALEKGADTIVSSEGKHHLIQAACEKGMNLLLLTHACSEEYGFHKFYLRLKKALPLRCAYYAEKRFL